MSTRAGRRRRERTAAERAARPAVAGGTRASTWAIRSMAVVLALLGLVPMANLVTDGPGLPWWGAAVRDWFVASLVLLMVALALARLLPHRIELLRADASRLLLAPAPRVFGLGIALLAMLLTIAFGWYLFQWLPVTGDEFSQQWQARLLTAGRLFARSEARPEFFSTAETLDRGGRWLSQFPIGGPAILAIGLALGAPWLVNPVLSGLTAFAFYRFVAITDDEQTARAAALLLALCPFFIFMGGSEMNHTATLACVATAFAAVATWHASAGGARATRASALLGAVMGIAAAIRPFDAAIVATGIGIFQLHTITQRPELRRSLIAQFIAGGVPVIALLACNWVTVGSPLTFGYDALHGAAHRPGFHLTPLGFEHTPRRGLYMISAYLMKLDAGMLGWPVPVLTFVVSALLFQRVETRWDRLLIGVLAMILVGYAVYWGESYFLGPRYLFIALPILLLYVARFPHALRDRLRSPTLRAATSLLVPLSLAIGLLTPPIEGHIASVWGLARQSRMKGSEASLLVADAGRNVPPRSLVFIDDGWHSRLAARLRVIGVRPLMAEQIASSADACTLQRALDAVEVPATSDTIERLAIVMAQVARDAPAAAVPGLSSATQLAFVPGRPLPAECQRELGRTSAGVTMDELLPFEPIAANGAIDGPIVYARDFGPRNELLRARFGDRAWFVAHRREYDGRREFRFVPYQPPAR